MSFSVKVPASSANLGPGFDSLAIALDIWLEADVYDDPGVSIVDGGGSDLAGGENLVISAMHYTARQCSLMLPGCRVNVASAIPVARGLGSSAAAIVAGVNIALELAGQPANPETLINIAGSMEGHADNVAAAMLGGITAAIQTENGAYIASRLASSVPWAPLLFIPDTAAFTSVARGVLPDRVPLADAAANVGRAALLVHSLMAGDERIIREAMLDRLHQPYRAKIFPHLLPVLDAAISRGAIGTCLSGAGPTILALVDSADRAAVGDAMMLAARSAGVAGEILLPRISTTGCILEHFD